MPVMLPRRAIGCVVGAVLVLCGVVQCAHAAESAREVPPAGTVRDLDYGDVLFHFFQDDYFAAIVRLEANRDFGRLEHHRAEAELLSGGLYLSLGLHAEATRIFDRLLAGTVPVSVSDRARFYLARIGYQRGYNEEALRHLQRIVAPLPGALEPERQLLAANVLMALGRYGDAAQMLNAWTDASAWATFARFNLGVAYVRSGDLERGRSLLEQVGTATVRDEEQAALRDRANLALGFALLQRKGSDDAAAALTRVRLDGPFTNRALLALGWAETNANRPERALVPWLELQDRKLLDAAVQESLLAVPYAYVRLASNGQASQHYRAAMDAYVTETRRIDASIAAIRAGGFLDSVLAAVPDSKDIGWFWQLQKLPDAPQTRYLYQLLASHEFQEGLKNYRDLRLMQANLARWRESLAAFEHMIAAREAATGRLEPHRREVLQSVDLAGFEQRQAQLTTRFKQALSARDVVEFADEMERAQWQMLDRTGDTLAAMPRDTRSIELGERARLLRGTLLWQLDRDFKVRAANAERGLQQTDAALAQARARLQAIAQAGDLVPANTRGFDARVAALAQRIDAIVPAVDATALAQERVLAELAVQELLAQKQRLDSYTMQAQFALASLYDGAATGGGR